METLRKTRFIDTLVPGEEVVDVWLVDRCDQKETKTGKPYWMVDLKDRTGTIGCRMWDPPIEPLVVGSFAKIQAEVLLWDGKPQLKITKARPLGAEEAVDATDFLPRSPHDTQGQVDKLSDAVAGMTHRGLQNLCWSVLLPSSVYGPVNTVELAQRFREAPAAKGNHQPYVGGLLDHVVSLVGLAELLSVHYKLLPLSTDLLIAAAIFHDIGKVREMSWVTSIDYSIEGMLIGHISMGLSILDKLEPIFSAAGADDTVWLHLRHIIASHHGKIEWGSERVPMTREAALFHQLDMIDSRMAGWDEIEKQPVDTRGFTPWNRMSEGKAWRP